MTDDIIKSQEELIEFMEGQEPLNEDQKALLNILKRGLQVLKNGADSKELDQLNQELADLKEISQHKKIAETLYKKFVLGEDVEPIQS